MVYLKIKKSGNKYKIYLDNEVITTYDDVILKYNILYKKDIDEDLIKKIKEENSFYENYNKALRLINTRLRSEYEIVSYLQKQKCENIDAIILKLKSIGLINDYNFAVSYTNDKINLTLDGPDKIKKSLEKLKVDSNIVNECLSNIDINIVKEHLNKLINKKTKTLKYTGNVLKQKLTIYLVNMGYSRSLINECLTNLSNNNIDSEMEKIFRKLSLKYSDNELKYKLRNRLYAKGFTISEINEFIKKSMG